MTRTEEIRTTLGLSVTQFARALGVTAKTVYRWSSGDCEPVGTSAEILDAIAMAIEDDRIDRKTLKRRVSMGVTMTFYRGLSRR
jgi:transcriptional regulator with XRE-family HTH domain